MKRIISCVLCLVFLVSVCTCSGITAFAAQKVHKSGDFEYVVQKDGTVQLLRYQGTEETLTLPAKLGGRKVTYIKNEALWDDPILKHPEIVKRVTIPDGIKIIGQNAFNGCTALESVTVSKSVSEIGDYAFYNAKRLKTINVGNQLQRIGDNAFKGTKYYKTKKHWKNGVLYLKHYALNSKKKISGTVRVKNKTVLIAEFAFAERSRLIGVQLPESVDYICSSAFANSKKLKRVKLPEKVKRLGSHAFRNCAALETVVLPKNLKKIENDCFFGCMALKSVVFPKTLKEIDSGAFEFCEHLAEVDFPKGLESIGYLAFRDCVALQSLVLPATVSRLGDSCFSSCYSLKSVEIQAPLKSLPDSAFSFCKALENVLLPATLKKLESGVFYRCESLKSITLPSSLKNIGGGAFADCTALEEVRVTGDMEKIGADAFYNTAFFNRAENRENGALYLGTWLLDVDEAVESCSVKEGTAYAVRGAFRNCNVMKSLSLPSTMKDVGDYNVFDRCDSLEYIKVAPNNCVYSSEDGVLMNNDKTVLLKYPNKKGKVYTIPSTVSKISNFAFYEAPLRSIVIPKTVKTIGQYAFAYSKLTELTLKNGVEEVQQGAFCNTPLTKVFVPRSVKVLGEGAFGVEEDGDRGDGWYADYYFLTKPGFVLQGYYATEAERYCTRYDMDDDYGYTVAFEPMNYKAPQVSVTGGKGLIRLNYRESTRKMTGFQVKYGKKKQHYRYFACKAAAVKTIKKLKKGDYTVQVRSAFKKKGKTYYSRWSAPVTVVVE